MLEPFTPTFLRRLQQLKIRTRRSFLGSRQGTHASLRRGQGLEFSDFRPYTPGDDYRHIDWGVYGCTDRIYIREFRAEQELNVAVLLDTSASMGHPAGSKKFDLARDLALSIGYIALADGDSVTFSLLGSGGFSRFGNPRAIAQAVRELRAVTPGGTFDLPSEMRKAAARQRIPGKCFVISDFLVNVDSVVEALQVLRNRNFEIVVVQVLAPEELTLSVGDDEVLVDAETGEEISVSIDAEARKAYTLALGSHVQAIERYCRRANIVSLLVSSAEPVQDVVLRKFPDLGLVR